MNYAKEPEIKNLIKQALKEDIGRGDITTQKTIPKDIKKAAVIIAKEKGIDGICLLGEVPTYATRIPNPKAALAILEILTKMLGIEINLSELISLAKEAEEEMKKVAAQAMGEFIDQFTKPIWEQEPREEEEE